MESSSKIFVISKKERPLTRNSAMMCAISEAWEILNTHLGMEYDDIGKVFEKWSTEGELVWPHSHYEFASANNRRKIPSWSKLVLRFANKSPKEEITSSVTSKIK
jgi:hypothetical protein